MQPHSRFWLCLCLFISAGCSHLTGLPASAPATPASPVPSATSPSQAPADNSTLATRSLSVKLNADALTAEQRHRLADQLITVSIQDAPEPGASRQPAQVEISTEQETITQPLSSPNWRYKSEQTIRIDQQATFEKVPLGLNVVISVAHTLRKHSCSELAEFAMASRSVHVTEQLESALELKLTGSPGSDIGVCIYSDLQGHIYNQQGQPVVGAQVKVHSLVEGLMVDAVVNTDDQGAYRLSRVPTETSLEIEVTAPGYASLRQIIKTQPNLQGDPKVNIFDFELTINN